MGSNSLLLFIVAASIPLAICSQSNNRPLTLSLTISARTRSLEVSWRNAQIKSGDILIVTTEAPTSFRRRQRQNQTDLESAGSDFEGSGGGMGPDPINGIPRYAGLWECNNSSKSVIYEIVPKVENEWITTTIPFDYSLSRDLTRDTKCYGFWVSYIDTNGTILSTGCIRAYPRWMNEMRPQIENLRMRDLFIPGTHDSGSYRLRFDPLLNETLVTKYSLTQDDDAMVQLKHGIRYLDIRVGFYRSSNDLFWANHGISRQQPLREIIQQLIDFVEDTNEIVIFDVQEFPVGFGKTLDIHRKLVNYLKTMLGVYIVDPSLTWQATLKDIWQRKQNIIVCYDHVEIVEEYPTILFHSAEQKWGNVQTLNDLRQFLTRIDQIMMSRYSDRPIAAMAELTPDAWGVLTDRFGGLRFLSDHVNRFVSKWYEDDYGTNANIVAVDFYRGTTIVETAIRRNLMRIET